MLVVSAVAAVVAKLALSLRLQVSLDQLWDDVSARFWFLPAMMTAGAVVELDRAVQARPLRELEWLWTGDAEGARVLLSTNAESMTTIAGVVLLITLEGDRRMLRLQHGWGGASVARSTHQKRNSFLRATGQEGHRGSLRRSFESFGNERPSFCGSDSRKIVCGNFSRSDDLAASWVQLKP